MNKSHYIMPGVIQVTGHGPCVECDDKEWLRNLYREIGLDPDLVNEGDRDHGHGRTIQQCN